MLRYTLLLTLWQSGGAGVDKILAWKSCSDCFSGRAPVEITKPDFQALAQHNLPLSMM
jgi:hypothetical protein